MGYRGTKRSNTQWYYGLPRNQTLEHTYMQLPGPGDQVEFQF